MCCVEDEQFCSSLIMEQMFVWYLNLGIDQKEYVGEMYKFGNNFTQMSFHSRTYRNSVLGSVHMPSLASSR